MICIHHNKDLDGHTSGMIVKRKFPECELIGWDYGMKFPDFEKFRDKEVIMIDVTFPIQKIRELLDVVKHLTIIDHHISFKNEFVKEFTAAYSSDTTTTLDHIAPNLFYRFTLGEAACEIGWKYFFPEEELPFAITLLGRYDTWRQEEGNWKEETLPFQYAMRAKCTSPETFPLYILDKENYSAIQSITQTGKDILHYQNTINEKAAITFAFEKEFKGYRAICLNAGGANSQMFDSVWDENKYDLMIPFVYNGKYWKFSLYTTKDIDCSELAREMGGGGHKQAAGFELDNFEDAFKQ